MTEQQPPAEQQPPPSETSSTPPPPPSGWASTPAPATVPGTAGFVYADVPNRVIAYIIDAVILGIVFLIISWVIVGNIFPNRINPNPTGLTNLVEINYAGVLVNAVIQTALSALYFIYMWTAMRGTIGMKALSLQVGNAADGRTLTQAQAIRRWIFLGGPLGLISALNPIPAIGILLGLAGLAYYIYLLWTTAQSPTKQGFHDVQAGTVVVKAARTVS
jgi:uncharacterized RDD family membrane protein YckC